MTQETVNRLKELLFDAERGQIDQLRARLEDVARRAGSDAQFRRSVADVLDGALRDAEAARHREVADALAPLVVRTVRTEVANQQEELPAKLYPHIGKMVRDYVASAIRDLMEDINRRLESGLTNNRVMLRLRSLTTGRSMAELALRDVGRLDVEELHLIRRGSGELLAHWSRDGVAITPDGAGGNRGVLFSGLLTAMTDFIEEVYEADKASLRAIDFGGHTVFLRGSPDRLLAAKCRGIAGAGTQRILDDEFLEALDASAGIDDEARRSEQLAGLATRLEQRAKEHARDNASGGMRPLKVLAGVVLVPLVAFLLWDGYVRIKTARLQAAADAVIAGVPALKGYPTRAVVSRGGGSIEVSGLAPTPTVRNGVIEGLRRLAPTAHIVQSIGVVPGGSVGEMQAELERLRGNVSGLQSELERSAVARAIGRASARIDAVLPELASVEQSVRDPQTRRRLATTIAGVRSARSGLQQAAAEAVRAPVGAGELAGVLARLRDASRELRTLLDPGAPAASSPGRPAASDDATASADQLPVLAEQIATLTLALKGRLAQQPLEARIAELARRLESLPAPAPVAGPTPRQQLEAWTRSNAIFFSSRTDFRSEASARAKLDALAGLLKQSDGSLRIIGYTDERGSSTLNQPLALARARRVADGLAERGIPADRLVVVGRGTGFDISAQTGEQSANRRVTFEPTYIGETEGAP